MNIICFDTVLLQCNNLFLQIDSVFVFSALTVIEKKIFEFDDITKFLSLENLFKNLFRN